jgi:hypothetical protein
MIMLVRCVFLRYKLEGYEHKLSWYDWIVDKYMIEMKDRRKTPTPSEHRKRRRSM